MRKSLLLLLLTLLYGATQHVNGRVYIESELFTIETENTSYIVKIDAQKSVFLEYYGAKISDPAPFLLKQSYRRADHGTDNLLYNTAGGRNFREPALRVTHHDGAMNTELEYVSHKTTVTKDENVSKTVILLRDRVYALDVELTFHAYYKEDVITQSVKITNKEKKQVVLHNFYSMFLPIKAQKYYLNTFYGAWAMEMTMQERVLGPGIVAVESKKGVRTTHSENPSFVLALDTPLDENHGNVIAGALAWSGNYKLNFEVDEHKILNITAGINPYASEYNLAKGESFTTPEMVVTHSQTGAGGASRNLHDWARNYNVYDPKTIRPTLLNNWEGTYFNFDEGVLTQMIDDATSMGLELFVLDDGWFGNNHPRNAANAGLGDWQVNKTKLPKGIAYVADYAASKGIGFGIWIEPEMVNPESDLAKAHPEWIVTSKGREITTMRQQWLLDLTNPKVQDFVFGVFDNVMKLSPNISFVKWDANRHVEGFGSSYLPADKQSHFWIEYTQGLYRVYERIREEYPNVLIQACSSGGGRVDFGALKYHQEVWTSDNTDPLSRIYIQYGTNMIYPALVTGSHVSSSPSHQTNNISSLKFRFDMAMTGRLGMELQPSTMSEKDREFARKAIENYKGIRDIVMFGDLYRIISPYDGSGWYSLMYASKDQKRAVVYGFNIDYQGRVMTPILKLNGLDPSANYKITELNVDRSKFWGDQQLFSGEYLMNEGINPQLVKRFDSAVFLVEMVGK